VTLGAGGLEKRLLPEGKRGEKQIPRPRQKSKTSKGGVRPIQNRREQSESIGKWYWGSKRIDGRDDEHGNPG